MIVDFHASCGNVATTGKDWSLDDLAHWADLSGVDTLIVESLDARYHADDAPHERLLAACRASGGRFLPAATVSLNSDIRSIEVASLARGQGFACVVLREPMFEESRVLHEVLGALSKAPLPVYRELAYDELDMAFRVAREHADISFVFAPNGYEALELNHRLVELPNVYIAMAHTFYALGQVETACRRMGADRILYASDMPPQHPARPLGAIYDAEISEADRDMVLGGSAQKLLARHGIKVPRSAATPPRLVPPCPIIDTHGHIGADCRRPDYDSSVDALLRFLRRAGGELVYISSTEGIYGDVVEGNRQAIEVMKAHPDCMRGYLVINPWRREACLDDIRRCREWGFSGLKPYPRTFGHLLSDPIMDPVLELAEKMGLPMLSHALPDDLRAALEKYPRLRMLAAHMTFFPDEKARLAREYPNTVLEISGAGVGVEDVVRAVEIAGEENLVFGSDLTAHSLGFTLYPLLCSGLPETTLRAILRDNALRFFGDTE